MKTLITEWNWRWEFLFWTFRERQSYESSDSLILLNLTCCVFNKYREELLHETFVSTYDFVWVWNIRSKKIPHISQLSAAANVNIILPRILFHSLFYKCFPEFEVLIVRYSPRLYLLSTIRSAKIRKLWKNQ